jgi:hypothetical protein
MLKRHNNALHRTAMSAVSAVTANSSLVAALVAVGQLGRWRAIKSFIGGVRKPPFDDTAPGVTGNTLPEL